MAGYKPNSAPAAPGKVDLSEQAIDNILDKMQDAVIKIDELQGKMVKLRNAEVELLKQFEAGRNYMMDMLQNPTNGREGLQNIFGGDCKRIARIRMCLETAKFSDMYASDQRHPDCLNACESVEQVLKDLGLGWALRQALEQQKEALKARRSGLNVEEMQAAVATAETPVMETPVVEEAPAPEPEPPKPEPPKKKDLAPATFSPVP